MVLQAITLHNFRNHEATSCEFGRGVNALMGENGQGKTNILEAISYICLTKSFYASNDAHVLKIGSSMFDVEGSILFENGSVSDVRVAFAAEQHEKAFSVNKRRIEPFSSVIGKFPIVICSPEHAPITSGGPAERRRFMDFIISQSNAHYFRELIEYRRVIKHRSKILIDAKISRSSPDELLAPWDVQLIKLGTALTVRRAEFLLEFQEFIVSAYRQLAGAGEEPEVVYVPNVATATGANEEASRLEFERVLEGRRPEELRMGTTLVGPHRDEIDFRINALELRKYASQGQQKTFLVALKLAEFYYLKDRRGETPLLLLDDVFSELDEHRAGHLLQITGELSQTFVTSTNTRLFDDFRATGGEVRKFLIHQGAAVEDQSELAV